MNLGPMEILVILVVALVLFGPSKLPELGKSLGKGIREFKRGTQGLKDELEISLKDEPAAARPAAAPVAQVPTTEVPAAPAQQTVYAAAPQPVSTSAQAEAAPAAAPLRAADLAVSPAVPVPAAEPAAPQEPAHRA